MGLKVLGWMSWHLVKSPQQFRRVRLKGVSVKGIGRSGLNSFGFEGAGSTGFWECFFGVQRVFSRYSLAREASLDTPAP